MPDMLVKLYDLPDAVPGLERLKEDGIVIKRALPYDKYRVLDYVRKHFDDGWAGECDVSFSNKPVSCFIALKDKSVTGFACYDATTKDYFGPTGITGAFRGKGIGTALLYKCLLAMREEGYAYAIIGMVTEAIDFYRKTVNAAVIEDSHPGFYSRLIDMD